MNQMLHFLAEGALRANGFQWEVRRQGEIKIGYWKKILRTKSASSAYPKRFVLLPGFGDTSLSWNLVRFLLQPILKSQFDEILFFDFPGFGGFLKKERSFPSMDLMISVISDAFDSLKPHTIVGHSLGGWLTAIYASQCGAGTRPLSNQLDYSGPQTIALINPSGLFSNEQVRADWENMFRSSMVEGFSKVRPHLFFKEPIWFPLMVPHFDELYKREDILQFMRSFREDHSVDSIIGKIKADCWLIWGEKDSLIPVSCASTWIENLAPDLSRADRVVVLRGIGHSPQLEAPVATAAVIAQIISAKGGQKVPTWVGKWWWKFLNDAELKHVEQSSGTRLK